MTGRVTGRVSPKGRGAEAGGKHGDWLEPALPQAPRHGKQESAPLSTRIQLGDTGWPGTTRMRNRQKRRTGEGQAPRRLCPLSWTTHPKRVPPHALGNPRDGSRHVHFADGKLRLREVPGPRFAASERERRTSGRTGCCAAKRPEVGPCPTGCRLQAEERRRRQVLGVHIFIRPWGRWQP